MFEVDDAASPGAQPIVSVLRRRDVPLADDIRALMDAVPFPGNEKTLLLPARVYERIPREDLPRCLGIVGLIFWSVENTAICIYKRPKGHPIAQMHVAVLDLGPCEG